MCDCSRQDAWRRMLKAVGDVRDRLGMPVDPGIRDTVAALNLAGLPTLQSCEGHVNARGHGLPAPWVDFVNEPQVLDGVRSLLGEFYASHDPDVGDARLTIHGDRLSNGGSLGALEATRAALARAVLDPSEVDGLRARLVVRQAEMRRFTAFLRQRPERARAA